MKKAVLFARVSSEKQTYERQLSDLKPLIMKDGYSENEIAIVNYKESATKNDIASRKSIRELKEIIESNPIEQVYVTEVSRLSRRGDVMYGVLALLEEHNIGLVIQTPTLIRTIENGKKNQMAHIILQFLYQVAEAESNIKLERQLSGWKQKQKEGKVLSSVVKFGYSRNKDGYAEIVKEDALIVNEIFDRYIAGESASSLYDRFKHIVNFGNIKHRAGCNRVWRILQDETYIGKNKNFLYPRIITDEKFELARKRRFEKKLVKTKHKYIYYCTGLVKLHNYTMSPTAPICSYWLYNHNGKSWSVNINAIDSLAWLMASMAKTFNGEYDKKENMVNLRKTLDILKKKREGIKNDILSKEKEADRVNTMFQKDRLSEEKYDYLSKKVGEEIKYLEKENEENDIAIIQVEQSLLSCEKEASVAKKLDDIYSIVDDNLRRDIIKETIKSINLTEIGKAHYYINFEYVNPANNRNQTFEYITQGRYVHLYDKDGQDFTSIIEKRIDSRKVTARKKAEKASNLRSKPL
jgi:DNA invertase Pin-like site-specific DNA recombinase